MRRNFLSPTIPLALIASTLLPLQAIAQPDILLDQGRLKIATTGEDFIPRGFNYIRLWSGMHGTFNPQVYQASMIDSMFSNLSDHRFNVVRVFIDRNVHVGGIVESDADSSLSSVYIDNVVDFLERARKSKIYVIPTIELFPLGGKYHKLADSFATPSEVDAANYWQMHPGFIEAKKAFIVDFLDAIRTRNPDALQAIMAVDLDNEAAYTVAAPFTLTTGSYTGPNGRTYDLSSEKTSIADDIAQYQVNAYCDAVHTVMPKLLVDISMFTYGAVNRTGPGDFSVKTEDWANRYPFRPTTMIASKADIVDLHTYQPDTTSISADLATVEYSSLKASASSAGKPLLVGEFGVFKSWALTPQAVDDLIRKEPEFLLQTGFSGWLYWTYDGFEQPDLINAADNDWELFSILAATIGGDSGNGGAGTGGGSGDEGAAAGSDDGASVSGAGTSVDGGAIEIGGSSSASGGRIAGGGDTTMLAASGIGGIVGTSRGNRSVGTKASGCGCHTFGGATDWAAFAPFLLGLIALSSRARVRRSPRT